MSLQATDNTSIEVRLLKKNLFTILALSFLSAQVFAESLSYSGRLVNANGSPVTGEVDLIFDAAYSDDTNTIVCTQSIDDIALSNGVFHVELDFSSSCTISDVLANTPVNERLVIRVTDNTNTSSPKAYAFQSVHSVPKALVADKAANLLPLGASSDGDVLVWNSTSQAWEAGTVSGATGGTVTEVTAGSGLTASPNPITATGTISLSDLGTAGSYGNATTIPVITTDSKGRVSNVTNTAITGLAATAISDGSIDNTEFGALNGVSANIQTQLDSKEASLSSGAITQYYRGDKSWQTLDTSVVPENGNLYFLDSRVRNALLSGYSIGTAVPIAATDTLLEALQKLEGQIAANDSDISSINESQWTSSGSDIYYNSGNVGIGTGNPESLLTVNGSQDTSGNAYTPKVLITGDQSNFPTMTMKGVGDASSASRGYLFMESWNLASSGGSNGSVLLFSNYRGDGSLDKTNNIPNNAGDILGEIDFRGSTAGSYQNTASIQVQTTTGTDAVMKFRVRPNNGPTTGGGSSKMVIMDSGNVGVGTETPSEKLEVNGNVKATAFIGDGSQLTGINSSSSSNTGDVVISADSDSDTNGEILFQTGGTTQAVIDNSGNMGIGIGAPSAGLHVYRSGVDSVLKIETDNSSENSLLHLRAGGNDWQIVNDSGNNKLAFNFEGSDLFNISQTGNVGIGASSPDTKLVVAGDDGEGAISIKSAGAGVSGAAGKLTFRRARGTVIAPSAIESGDIIGNIVFNGYGDSVYNGGARIRGMATENWDDTSAGAALVFQTKENGTTTWMDRLFIDDDGRVGVGTTSPAGTFHVDGGTSSSNGGDQIVFQTQNAEVGSGSKGGNFKIFLGTGDSNDNGTFVITPNENYPGINGSGSIKFMTENTNSGNNIDIMTVVGNNDNGVNLQPFMKMRKGNSDEGLLIGRTPTGGDSYIVSGNSSSGAGGALYLRSGNNNGLAIVDDQVGVGKNGPTEKLDVAGNVKATAFIGDGSQLTGISSSSSSNTGDVVISADSDSDTNGEILFNTQGVTRAVIDNSGRVGIGGNSAFFSLDVTNSNSTIMIRDAESNPLDGSDMGTLGFGTTANGGQPFASIAASRVGTSADDVSNLVFKTSFATGAGGDGVNLERMRITHDGNVGINNPSPTSKLHVVGRSTSEQALLAIEHNQNNNQRPIFHFKKTRGSITAPLAVEDQDMLGEIIFQGYVDDDYRSQASIRTIADGTPSSTSYPSSLLFYTTAEDETVREERMRISKDGKIGIGTSAPSGLLSIEKDFGDITGSYDSGLTMNLSANAVGFGQFKPNQIDLTLTGATNFQSVQGLGIKVTNNLDANNETRLVGHSIHTSNSSDSSNTYGQRVYTSISAGTLNNYYGVELRAPNVSGTGVIDKAYGLYIDNHAPTGVTDGWGVYQVGVATKNYFAGDVGVGVSTPTEKLDVDGNVKATAFIGDGSQLTGVAASSSSNTGDVVIGADSDSDTNGEILFQTGGTTQAVIDNSGNFALGSTSASAKLDVTSVSGPIAEFNLADNVASNFVLKEAGNNYFSIDTIDGSEEISIGSTAIVPKISLNGNVHINNDTASAQLVLRTKTAGWAGQLNFYADDSSSINKEFARMIVDPVSITAGSEQTNIQYRLLHNGTLGTVMNLRSNGRLGLAVSNPQSKIHISGDRDSMIYQHQSSQMPDGNDYDVGGIIYQDNHLRDSVSSDPAAYMKIVSTNTNAAYPQSVRGTQLHFGTADGNDGQGTLADTKMMIDHKGRVGIGTTNPGFLLDINGTTDNNNRIRIGSTGGGIDSGLQLDASGTRWFVTNDGNGSLGAAGNFHIASINHAKSRFAIDHDTGNVGIGTTSPTAKLQVAGTVRASSFQVDSKTSATDLSSGTWYRVATFTGGNTRGKFQLKYGGGTPGHVAVFHVTRAQESFTSSVVENRYSGLYGTSAQVTKYRIVKKDQTEDLHVDIYHEGADTAQSPTITLLESSGNINLVDFTEIASVDAGFTDIEFKLEDIVRSVHNEKFVFKNDGSFGLGTSDPQAKLHLEGDGSEIKIKAATNNISNSGKIVFEEQTSTAGVVLQYDGSSSFNGDGALLIKDKQTDNDLMTVERGGYVGIGTASPIGKLHIYEDINGSALFGIQNPNTGTSSKAAMAISHDPSSVDALFVQSIGYNYTPLGIFQPNHGVFGVSGGYDGLIVGTQGVGDSIKFFTANNQKAVLTGDGDLGIGTASPSEKLHVVGNLRVQGSTDCTLGGGSGATNCTSDIRLKDNVQEIDHALEKITSLRGVEFIWNELSLSPGQESIGVIAQDIQKVFPTAVIKNADGYLSVDYAVLVAPLIGATKELAQNQQMYQLMKSGIDQKQDRKIASLEAKVEQLQKKNQDLEARLERLEKLLGK